jgi:hypothetical protein
MLHHPTCVISTDLDLLQLLQFIFVISIFCIGIFLLCYCCCGIAQAFRVNLFFSIDFTFVANKLNWTFTNVAILVNFHP